jgi:hypothetical protein
MNTQQSIEENEKVVGIPKHVKLGTSYVLYGRGIHQYHDNHHDMS